MRCFWDERQRRHAPAGEFFNGALHPAAGALAGGSTRSSARYRADRGARAITASSRCCGSTAGLSGFPPHRASPNGAPPAARATPSLHLPGGRPPAARPRPDRRLARPICASTRRPRSARAPGMRPIGARRATLSALDAVLGGERSRLRLLPPARHHAGPIISAAIPISTMPRSPPSCACAGGRRVAILDVDYHHGNGTQDIVAGREDIVFASIHADPRTDYPYLLGPCRRERRQHPQPAAAARHRLGRLQPALIQALDWIEKARPTC